MMILYMMVGNVHKCINPVSSYVCELLSLQREAVEEMWGGKEEPDRILMGLELACKLEEADLFRQPVDLQDYPRYCRTVAFPTDLSTIIRRLQNNYYRYVKW